MRLALTGVTTIILAALAAGCSSSGGLFSVASSQAPLSPEQEAQEDQKCQSTGYQFNTPAYQYCRSELARQRAAAESYQAVPSISAHR
jgi:hypothetical protein